MKESIRLTKINEVYFQAHLSREQYLELKDFFSHYAEDYKFQPKYKAGLWDGKICFLDKYGRFPIGLFQRFLQFCDKFQYDVEVDFDENTFKNHVSETFLTKFFESLFPPEKNIYPRDYQQEAVQKAITYGRGVLNLATSSGKSLIIYCLLRYLIAMKKNVLVIVPNISLVEQLFSDFKNDYGWEGAFNNVCLNYGGKQIDHQKRVLLTTWQSVYKNDESFFQKYDGLIIDEAHSMTGKSIQSIASKCVNASFRIGLTGTMPKNEADLYNIVGYLGQVIHKIMSIELIEKGVISKIKIRNLILKYPREMRIARSNYQGEVDDINSYKKRNRALNYILDIAKPDENVLILVTKIEHLLSTKKYIEDCYPGKKVYEIYGNTEGEIREEIRKSLEKDSGAVLVASYGTFSTGSNVKKLHHIVLFSSYKSQIKVLQSIGRGLRKHESKEFVTIWDCCDDMQYTDGKKVYKNWTYLHWEKNRLTYYKEQQFDYSDETFEL